MNERRPSFRHLRRLTDQVGIVQHARLDEPYYAEGYSLDDNARALILMCAAAEAGDGAADLEGLAARYLAYIADAWNPGLGRFRNFRSAAGHWLEPHGSEDSHGRALQALGHASRCPTWDGHATRARAMFLDALPALEAFTSPRAWAFGLLGIDAYMRRPGKNDDTAVAKSRAVLAQRLLAEYRAAASDGWPWFEEVLSYCNAKLPHALLRTGIAVDRDDMIETALGALAWLAEIHAAGNGHFVPIGSDGFYRKGGRRATFDQQPIEAQAVVDASLDAYRLTADRSWLDEAVRAHAWFLGRNDLGVPVGDPVTGACCDGLHPDRPNLNKGAESTLAYLLSSLAMQRPEAATER